MAAFCIDYVSGPLGLHVLGDRQQSAFFYVANAGDSDELVRVFGYRDNLLMFDSKIDFSPEKGPCTGDIAPGEMWVYERELRPSGGGVWWFRIRVTSEDLVPSIDLIRSDMPEPLRYVREHWWGPNDFRAFPARFPIPDADRGSGGGPVVA